MTIALWKESNIFLRRSQLEFVSLNELFMAVDYKAGLSGNFVLW